MRTVFLALLLLLTACAPVAPLAAASPTPVSITPLPTATPGTTDGVALLPLATDLPGIENPTTPELILNPAEEGVVISGTFCCGYSSQQSVLNYLPEFQIRADGTYIWVQFNADGSRRVLQADLTPEQITALLEQISAAGFFDWKDRYANNLVADYADKCLTVSLDSAEKSVCEYYEGAPQAFHELFAFLQSGAGQTGRPYLPELAFLKISRFDVDFVSPTLAWDEADLPLQSVPAEGAWVSGEALSLLWDAVNRAPWGPTIGENGTYYIFTIQVENLSPAAPPSPEN